MGFRFRKSIKICKGVRVNFSKSTPSLSLGGRGHSLNIGSRSKVTIGVPGTGLSYSMGLSGGKKKKSSSKKQTKGHSTSKARKTVEAVSFFKLKYNSEGKVVIYDFFGAEITDPAVIKKTKDTSEYKRKLEQLEQQKSAEIDEIIQTAEDENQKLINIYKASPEVATYDEFEDWRDSLELFEYEEADFSDEKPTEYQVRTDLEKEAKETVQGSIFKVGKMRRQYVEDNIASRLQAKIDEWEKSRELFINEQKQIKKQKDEEYQQEYDKQFAFRQDKIDGKPDIVNSLFEQWIQKIELPVEINIDYEWNLDRNCMMLDVDLPEIEDLNATKLVKTGTTGFKEKKKTQTELREEYSTLVFGLAIFLSANVFNLSPAINSIILSGYTQRRDKNGILKDDYIFSFKFLRTLFEGKDLTNEDPRSFCMKAENRCNLTSTSLFKTIVPFEE